MGEKSAPEGRGLVPTIKPPLSRPPTSLSSGGAAPKALHPPGLPKGGVAVSLGPSVSPGHIHRP